MHAFLNIKVVLDYTNNLWNPALIVLLSFFRCNLFNLFDLQINQPFKGLLLCLNFNQHHIPGVSFYSCGCRWFQGMAIIDLVDEFHCCNLLWFLFANVNGFSLERSWVTFDANFSAPFDLGLPLFGRGLDLILINYDVYLRLVFLLELMDYRKWCELVC